MPNPQVQAQALGSVDQADDRRSCQCSKVDLRCKSRPTAGKKNDTGCKRVSDGIIIKIVMREAIVVVAAAAAVVVVVVVVAVIIGGERGFESKLFREDCCWGMKP